MQACSLPPCHLLTSNCMHKDFETEQKDVTEQDVCVELSRKPQSQLKDKAESHLDNQVMMAHIQIICVLLQEGLAPRCCKITVYQIRDHLLASKGPAKQDLTHCTQTPHLDLLTGFYYLSNQNRTTSNELRYFLLILTWFFTLPMLHATGIHRNQSIFLYS